MTPPNPITSPVREDERDVSVATARLRPLGVEVRARDADHLPLADGELDLVLNRHGAFNAAECYRVLTRGGRLLTQQVGAVNDLEFNTALGISAAENPAVLGDLASVTEHVCSAGLVIDEVKEARPETRYLDIGAVVFQLQMVSWQAPGFDARVHRERLLAIQAMIDRHGYFGVRSQRFLLRAHRA